MAIKRQPNLIKAAHVQPFLQSMGTIGMPVSSILQGHNLDEEWLQNPNQLLPERVIWELLDVPRHREGIDDFGLLVTANNQIQDYGEFGRSILTASTLYEAIQIFIDEMPSQTTAPPFWTERCSNYLWFCREGIKGATKGSQQVEQHVLGLMVQTVRLAAGKYWSPPRVYTQSQTLCRSTQTDFLAGSVIDSNQLRTAIAIPKELLMAPLSVQPTNSSHEATNAVIPNSLIELVTDMVQLNSSPQRFELHSISAQLDVHPRQIQRLLKKEGTSFREIAGKLRIKAAKDLLASTELSITDVSTELGYTDQSNFWRAFVKGTGVSPSEYRHMTSSHWN
ncbi:hypothetical protein BCS96_01750 [Vibrio breoganii]|uniref:AraC family transcriptional regulator n=1 Tax=Vibrio breoganii TaxID=553239 RepID=UPI000C8479EF|nr:AraC family transcriptional regulator [Vibrio breoganii]PML87621.1 hypothetical protein BCT68_05180 [Vibrio breoganii]PMO97248.1 hypothetical protein BCS96_01750 [Vibrio breoganii]